uniref:B-box C-terminal domain-containing protein n=1 Tax=Branchiostoma floridae TaxID=7739 RepID=C3YCF5_BRAFL|eukprot:XP_002605982.1 hypothetical protein BRAFLDRAFT_92185 [Branchiostoma floridae]
MSKAAGPSNGENAIHARDDIMEETENTHCSGQEDEFGDDYIEPYLTTYHFGTCDVEIPGETTLASPQPDPTCHDVSFSKDTSRIHSHISQEKHSLDSRRPSTRVHNDNKNKTTETTQDVSQDATDKDDISDHEYTYIDDTSVEGRQDAKEEQRSGIATSHGLHPSQTDPTDHDYTYIDDHEYTYIDNTPRVDTQAARDKGSPGSVTSRGGCPSQATEPLKNASQQQGQKGMKVTQIMTKTFDVDGRPHRVSVSTSGKIAVALEGRQINIYDSRGVYLLHFLTVVKEKGREKTQIAPHDVAFGTVNNDDVSVVGGDNMSHYVAFYSSDGKFNTGFAIPRVSTPRRLVKNRLSNRVIVTETVGHRGEVKVFGMNGMLVRSFGRRQGLMYPTGITVDNKDYILVADSHTAYIYMYQENGRFLLKFAGKGSNKGQLNLPIDVCTDSSRHIIVADSGNQRVELFTSRGKLIRHIATDVDPLSIAMGTDGQLVMSESSKNKVTIMDIY